MSDEWVPLIAAAAAALVSAVVLFAMLVLLSVEPADRALVFGALWFTAWILGWWNGRTAR